MVLFAGVGDGHGDANIGVVAVGGERLCAVDHPFAADFFCRGASAASVGTGFGLGEGPAAQLFALRQEHDEFLLLVFVAELVDMVGAEGIVGGHDDADRAIDAGKLLDDDGVFLIAHSGAAILLGKDDTQKA